jgi:methionine-rich copper-binding protein CopC
MMARILAVALALVALVATGAAAHAFLDHAEPRVGSTVKSAPGEVKLWFTGAIEPAYSRVEVQDAAGKRVDRNDVSVDPASGALMRVSLPALPAGRYKVVWRVLSIDTHVTDGDFTFKIAP